MRIRRIELRGFKSFVDKTVFQLGPGVSGVVGPNGCGKSNVIDAIRWTLGEQSPSLLRGKAMEDVIFSGAEGRKPASVAEVHIAFDNSDGAFGGEYSRFAEIEVGRRLYRDGSSSYLINRGECRRKDIVGLFLDTGVGARAYSIIEQGRVGFIVNARPEERRVLIDEVAGINRFKAQRVEAERRMERTRNNLVRVADLITEMARQRRSLKIQAGRATRYSEMRGRWKGADLRALLGSSQVDRAGFVRGRDALGKLSEEEKGLQKVLDEAQAQSTQLRESAEQARRRHEELRERNATADSRRQLSLRESQFREEERRGLTERLERLSADVRELESDLRRLTGESEEARELLTAARRKLAGAEGRMATAAGAEDAKRALARDSRQEVETTKARIVEVMTEVARRKNQVSFIDRQLEEAEGRLAGLDEQAADGNSQEVAAQRAVEESQEALEAAQKHRAELGGVFEALEAEFAAARKQASESRTQFDANESERRRVEARHDSLEQLLAGMEGYGEGVRAFLDELGDRDDSGVLGTVAELLDPPAELEAAVELALGERLQGVVVEDLDKALQAFGGDAAGRVLLVSSAGTGEAAEGSLGTAVGSDSRAPGLASHLLGGSFVEEERVRDETGVWIPGREESGAGLLAQRREVRELADRLAELEEQANVLGKAREEAEQRLAELSAQREEAKAGAHSAELRELTCRRDLDEASKRHQRLSATTQREREERARLDGHRESLREERAGVVASIEDLEKERGEAAGRLEGLRGQASEAERQAEEASAGAAALRVDLASAEQEAASHQREFRRIEGQQSDVDRRVKRAEQERRTLTARETQLKELVEKLAKDAVELEGEQGRLGQEVAAAAAERETASVDWRRSEEGLGARRQDLEVLRRKIGAEEVSLAECRTALQAHRVRAAAAFDLDLDPLLEALESEGEVAVTFKGEDGDSVTVAQSEIAEPAQVEAYRQEALTLAAKIERLGPVNLAAAAEFIEVDARHEELLGQKEDLEAALGDLRKAIHKIETETRDRFSEGFRLVSERFSVLYPQLVGGGRAELRLTEPDNLLGTGIDIVVEPPGKRLQNLTLLSGGEKAMAAIALVFSIFQVKPSPFCLLDEVDAPLDDSNSRRFNGMLHEMSADTQFIVITHNRTTMEVADILYGVTMQTPGVSSVVSVQLEEIRQAS